MTAERWVRASDQDRDSAVELLSEAYAVGRLSREELDDRATAAYSAKTRGELRDVTADLLFPAARMSLPSETVALQRARQRADRHLAGEMIGIFELLLAAGLLGLVIPPAVWVAAVLIPVTLLLPRALGISRACGSCIRTRPERRDASRVPTRGPYFARWPGFCRPFGRIGRSGGGRGTTRLHDHGRQRIQDGEARTATRPAASTTVARGCRPGHRDTAVRRVSATEWRPGGLAGCGGAGCAS